MENMRGRRGTGDRAFPRQFIYEDFQPYSDWTHDSICHVLLVNLPGFKKEQLKLEVDSNGRVTISGERRLSEDTYSRFRQVFNVPEDSDVDKISGKFDGSLLFVIIPKKANVIKEEPKEEHQFANQIEEEQKQEASNPKEKPKKDDDKDDKHDCCHGIHEKKKEDNEGNLEKERLKFVFPERAMEMIIKNKGVVLAAVLGISFGLYISHKLRTR